ncbi:MAG: hypothetical protein P4L16_02170 [Chlamydiales bacterium]|nr:hypothetical protein [Chlamydiales bacterium]
MGKIVCKLFNLYPGEGKSSVLFILLAFIWSFASYCGVTLSDGMFLEHIGAKELPMAYLFTALSLFGISFLFLYAFNHFNAERTYFAALLFAAIGYLFIIFYEPLADLEGAKIYWFAFKIFCNILAVILTTCFWFFLDQYFNLQNAKRLYSLFNSSIFFGNACGSTFLSISLNTIGIKGISITIIALFITTVMGIFLIKRRTKLFFDDTIESTSTPEKQSLKSILKGFLKSKYTLILMGTYFIIQLINVITEYTYMQSFDAFFDTPRTDAVLLENRLTIFLGECTAWIALGNMFFGLFFYSRVVSRFGVNNIVGISPTFFLITFIFWGFTEALFVAILGLIVVEGISYTIDENNSNLLLNTVPSRLKNKARVAIDSFFEPLGMLVSALIFIFSDISSKELGLILTLASLIFVLLIKDEYRRAILHNLLHNALHFERKAKEWLLRLSKKERQVAKFHLIGMLKNLKEPMQLLAFEMLLQFKDRKILSYLLTQMNLMSMKGKIKVIELFTKSIFVTDPQVLDRFNTWVHKMPATSLKSALQFYFAKFGLLHPEKVKQELTSQDLILRASAILTLKTHTTHVQTSLTNQHLANQSLEELLNSPKTEEVCIGLQILSFDKTARNVELLIPFLKHPSIKIATHAAIAIDAIIDTNSRKFTTTLLNMLKNSSNSEYRIACLRSLGKIIDSTIIPDIMLSSEHYRPVEKREVEAIIVQMGLRAIPTLLFLTKSKDIPNQCRILSGRILGRLSLLQLRVNLFSIINSEIERAYFYFYHSYLPPSHESLSAYDRNLLQKALFTGYESAIDFIIQLLSVAGSIENSELLSHALRSNNQKIRGNAIEMLEKTCESRIFHLLKPLIDERPLTEKLKFYKKRIKLVSLEELLDLLENAPSCAKQIIALTLKAKLNLSGWRESLQKRMETKDELFHHFAYELLES